MEKSYTIGDKTFILDQAKAEEAFAAKKVINGKDTMFFNILPDCMRCYHLIVGIGGHTEIRYRHNQLCLEFAWSRKPFLKHLEKRLKKRFSEI